MDNSNLTPESLNKSPQQASWLLISVIVVFVIGIFVWFFIKEQPVPLPVVEQPPIEVIAPEVIVEPYVEEVLIEEPIQEPVELESEVVEVDPLPPLNESDLWLQEKLPTITWRKELLKLVIDDDMVRRFVVFTDNFSQGVVAYKYSPFVLPQTKFSATETKGFDANNQEQWVWNEQSEKRFALYVDLLRSFDSESLVDWYMDIKPLIAQAYGELGYPDDDFTDTLQAAITRVLDIELPKEPLKIIRPSVMYKYQDTEIEALDDVDKLLLRFGRENVLVIKSVLLEFSEKLARKEANAQLSENE